MKLCRFTLDTPEVRIGVLTDDQTDNQMVIDLSSAGLTRMQTLLEKNDPADEISRLTSQALPRHPLSHARLLTPVEAQEVWAAGVTYTRSMEARMDESDFSARAYDHVYNAARPELFFKSLPEKVAGPGEPVGIRADSKWNVPEPELALVINASGKIAGYTIGNDMSSRDIEGENLLYLPQAKIYTGSCAVGPCVVLAGHLDVRASSIRLEIRRDGELVYHGETRIDRIKRSFEELAGYLFRSQSFPNGAVLSTGTGIVPPDSFTLQANDRIRIEISGIGVLENTVQIV